MPSIRLTFVTALALAAVLVPAAGASAAQRYASPDGTGTVCSSASPCSFEEAVTRAVTRDEVIVLSGDYQLSETIADGGSITIHGVPGEPRPRLLFSGDNQFGLRLDSWGSVVRDVEIVSDTDLALFASGATVERTIVRGSGANVDIANIQSGSVLANSIVVATGTGSEAISTTTNGGNNSVTFRNVTAIATGVGGVGILASALGTVAQPGTVTITAMNVIARGGSGGADVLAETNSQGATAATVNLSHSNFAVRQLSGTNTTVTLATANANQSDAPAFVNPLRGNYRQAAGSSTIDAGLDDPLNGSTALDGQLRAFGTTDIGADEYLPAPDAVTGAASGVTTGAATLAGLVTAHGNVTSYRFEYGTTTAYGSATPTLDAGSGLTPVAVGAALSGLQPGTTYHYRLVAIAGSTATYGPDATFTTASAPAPTAGETPAGGATATAAFAGVTLASTRLASDGRRVRLVLRCPAGTAGGCSGKLGLSVRVRPAGAKRATVVALGARAFALTAGKRTTVTVRLTRSGRRLLARPTVLRATTRIAARDGAGSAKAARIAVRIRRQAQAHGAIA